MSPPKEKTEIDAWTLSQDFIALGRIIAGISSGKIVEHQDFECVFNPWESWFSRVYSAAPKQGQETRWASQLAKELRQAPFPASIMLSLDSFRPELESTLEAQNMGPYYTQKGMAIALADLPPLASTGVPVQIVQERAGLKDWNAVCQITFSHTKNPELLEGLMAHSAIDLLLIYQDGIPVSMALMHYGDRIAGIHVVGTAPEYRGKGYGRWITLYGFQLAKSRGCTLGVLQASEMGESVYRALGFQEVSRIEHWGFRTE